MHRIRRDGSPNRLPRTIGPGSPLHRLTDPNWVIAIHATVNGARFVKWGDSYYGGGPCHPFFPYKVGHLGRILGDFLRTWSFESRYITWGTGHSAPPSRGHHPPCSPEHCQSPALHPPTRTGQLVSKSDPPTRGMHVCTPPSPPAPGLSPPKPIPLAQSSEPTSTVNWSTPSNIPCGLGCLGLA